MCPQWELSARHALRSGRRHLVALLSFCAANKEGRLASVLGSAQPHGTDVHLLPLSSRVPPRSGVCRFAIAGPRPSMCYVAIAISPATLTGRRPLRN